MVAFFNMTKKTKREATPPGIVVRHCASEIGIIEHAAIHHLLAGVGTVENAYRPLAECYNLFVVGIRRKPAPGVLGLLASAHAVLGAVLSRSVETKTFSATEDEANTLRRMVETSNNFWSRRSNAEFLSACEYLRKKNEANQNG